MLTGNGDRLSGYDWRAWEKYDVDKVCAELDEEEQAVWQEGEKAKRELQGRCRATNSLAGLSPAATSSPLTLPVLLLQSVRLYVGGRT